MRLPAGPARRLRTKISRGTSLLGVLALALPLAVVSATNLTSASAASGPYAIDGLVPDSGIAAISDPSGNVKELGPINASTTKIGVIHKAPTPMLGLTNPNGQVDLNTVWLDLQRVGTGTSAKDWLYFAWQRDANSGSGFIAYEFMKGEAPSACAYDTASALALTQGCNPFASRAAGDFMILWDQQGGSRDLYLRTWSGTTPNLTLSGVTLLDSAISAAKYSADGFQGEAAVDLTGAGVTSGAGCTTLANTVPSTVTGNSDSADYKDTVLTTKRLSTCADVTIKKTSNTGALLPGAVFTLYNNVAPLAGPRETGTTNTDAITSPARTCTTAATGLCSMVDVPFGEYWVVETTPPTGYNGAADQALTVGSSTTPLLLTFVNTPKTGRIFLKKIGPDGAALPGATFSYSPPAGTALPLLAGQTAYFCKDGLAPGSYTVTEVPPPGYTGVTPFSVTVAADNKSCTTPTLSEASSVSNSLTNGNVSLIKKDDAGNPLVGVGFTLYNDVDASGTYNAGDTVAKAQQLTLAGGALTFTGVTPEKSYCIVESLPKAEYSTAGTMPHCFFFPKSTSTTGGTPSYSVPFDVVNPRKHKVIVLVCHEGTNTLAAGSVTIGGVTKQTTTTDATAEALCAGSAGATFGGIAGHATSSASIEITAH